MMPLLWIWNLLCLCFDHSIGIIINKKISYRRQIILCLCLKSKISNSKKGHLLCLSRELWINKRMGFIWKARASSYYATMIWCAEGKKISYYAHAWNRRFHSKGIIKCRRQRHLHGKQWVVLAVKSSISSMGKKDPTSKADLKQTYRHLHRHATINLPLANSSPGKPSSSCLRHLIIVA